jgi:hypothetical protein
MHRSIILAIPLLALVAACGPSSTEAPTATPPASTAAAPSALPSAEAAAGPAIIPILASSELAPGPNRFLFSLTDRDNQLVAAPDVTVDLLFYDADVDPDSVAFESDSRFLWALEDVRGLYVADVDFPTGGRWGTRFNATFPDGSTETVRADYVVLEESWTPALGAAAPSVDTPTLDDVDGELARLTTDPDPDPRFYETSVEDALAAGEPFVLVFATPAFCETATCGPSLDKAKAVATDFPDMTFINVEPYVMEVRDGHLQPVLSPEGQLQPAAWSTAWKLLTEPYVVVVDDEGIVRTKFEGAFAPDELRAAIEAL